MSPQSIKRYVGKVTRLYNSLRLCYSDVWLVGLPEQAEEFINKIATFQTEQGITAFNQFAPQITVAHIRAYCSLGKWNRAIEIYDAFEAAKAAGKVTHPLSNMVYHYITKSMIQGDDMVALVSFMQRFRKAHPRSIDIVPKRLNVQEHDGSISA